MYEIFGIIGTCFVLFAFLRDSEEQIRILDAIGAALFVVYGVLTKTWSTATLNAALILIQIIKLYKRRKKGITNEQQLTNTARSD